MRCLLIAMIILLLLIPPNSFSNGSGPINLALDASIKIDDYEIYFEKIIPKDDQSSKKRQIINELLTDIEKIKKDKQSMIDFNSVGDYEEAETLAVNIINLSDKIMAYECMFRLEEEKKTSDSYFLPLYFRGSELVKNITLGIENSELIIGDYEIIVDKSYKRNYDNYVDYSDECSELKTKILKNNGAARDVIGYGIIGFIRNLDVVGSGLLAITITYFLYLISCFLGLQKITKEKYLLYLFISLSIPWLFFIPQSGEGLFVTIILIILFGSLLGWFAWKVYLTILEHSQIHSKIKKIKKITPLSELEVSKEYEIILDKHGIGCLETLIEADVSDLSSETHLQIETLIKFKEKAKSILKVNVTDTGTSTRHTGRDEQGNKSNSHT